MYQTVNHFSNLGPLHRLIISLNKTKVMFSVAPGKSGKQPRITISGLELKAASNSPVLCNDRSPALLFPGSLSSRRWWSSLLQKEEQPVLIKPTYLGELTGSVVMKYLITDKMPICKTALPSSGPCVCAVYLTIGTSQEKINSAPDRTSNNSTGHLVRKWSYLSALSRTFDQRA